MSDDREVWKAILRGDAELFGGFYREHAPRLRAFLRQILGSVPAAEDVMQETFVGIWKKPGGFDPERGSLRGYLFGIGRKRAADWWRKQKPSEELIEDKGGPCQIETSSIVGDAFARLPEEQRTLMWLREVEGLSYAELAEALQIPVGTVRSRLFAAREAFRHIWHGQPAETGGVQR